MLLQGEHGDHGVVVPDYQATAVQQETVQLCPQAVKRHVLRTALCELSCTASLNPRGLWASCIVLGFGWDTQLDFVWAVQLLCLLLNRVAVESSLFGLNCPLPKMKMQQISSLRLACSISHSFLTGKVTLTSCWFVAFAFSFSLCLLFLAQGEPVALLH